MPERAATKLHVLPNSKDSGKRCKKAPPNNAPEAKATSVKRSLLKIFSFKDKNITPIKDIRLTRKVEMRIITRTDINPPGYKDADRQLLNFSLNLIKYEGNP
jgi:hypothetical protein